MFVAGLVCNDFMPVDIVYVRGIETHEVNKFQNETEKKLDFKYNRAINKKINNN